MRASILAWSTVSGVVMGVFIDATLIGVALLFVALWPELPAKLNQRWIAATAATVLLSVPIALAVLGYLEGKLKSA